MCPLTKMDLAELEKTERQIQLLLQAETSVVGLSSLEKNDGEEGRMSQKSVKS